MKHSTLYSVCDLASGFFQLKVKENQTCISAFVAKNALMEFVVCPMGMANSPASFVRAMSTVMKQIDESKALLYIDDALVLGETFEQHLENLCLVLSTFRSYNIKVKASKCKLFKTSIEYLGHVVNAQGICYSQGRIQCIKDLPEPTSVKTVRTYLGMTGFFRRFCRQYATTAAPLFKLAAADKKNFKWTPECREAWLKLKAKMISPEVLALPTPTDKFILTTDCSEIALGSILQVDREGGRRVVAYASHLLEPSRRKYGATKRELYAITFYSFHFRAWLYGRKYTIETDHKSLEFLSTFKENSAIINRWLSILSQFDYVITFRPHTNSAIRVCDSLSRPDKTNKSLDYARLDESLDDALSYTVPDANRTENTDEAADKTVCALVNQLQLSTNAIDIDLNPPTDIDTTFARNKAVLSFTRKYHDSSDNFSSNKNSETPILSHNDSYNVCTESNTTGTLLTPLHDTNDVITSRIFNQIHPEVENCSVTRDMPQSMHDSLQDTSSKWYHDENKTDNTQFQTARDTSDDMTPNETTVPRLNKSDLIEFDPLLAKPKVPNEHPASRDTENLAQQTVTMTTDNSLSCAVHTEEEVIAGPSTPQATQVDTENSHSASAAANELNQEQTLESDSAMSDYCKKIAAAQDKDDAIKRLKDKIIHTPDQSILQISMDPPVTKFYWARKNRLVLDNGILYYKDHLDKHRLIVPRHMVPELIKLGHDHITAGHRGAQKVLALLKQNYHWYNMRTEVEQWVRRCRSCAVHKKPTSNRPIAPLHITRVSSRFERLSVDFCGPFKRTPRNNRYCFLGICQFTKFAFAIPMSNMESENVAHKLIERWITYFGCPLMIHSDAASNLCSDLLKRVYDILGIAGTASLSYVPQQNGCAEKLVAVLKGMLSHFAEKKPTSWDLMTPLAILAINAQYNDTIKMTPHQMVFGESLRLPLTMCFGLPPASDDISPLDYAYWLQNSLHDIHVYARNNMEAQMQRVKDRFDKKQYGKPYKKDDLVWKLVGKFEQGKTRAWLRKYTGPYVVLSRESNVSYKIQHPITKKIHCTHFNLLKRAEVSDETLKKYLDGIRNNTDSEWETDNEQEQEDEDEPQIIVYRLNDNAPEAVVRAEAGAEPDQQAPQILLQDPAPEAPAPPAQIEQPVPPRPPARARLLAPARAYNLRPRIRTRNR